MKLLHRVPALGRAMAAALAVALPAAGAQGADNPLDAERWKTRPLVVAVPQETDPLLENVRSTLRQTAAREAFREREMVLYTVVRGRGERNGKPLDTAETAALLGALKLDPQGPAAFVLVGKDGGVKMRQDASVDLQAVFDEIDRMPMRQTR